MYSQRIDDSTFLIDLKPANLEGFIASYVLKGEKIAIIETGPASTVNNLLEGLKELNISFGNIDYVLVSHIHIDHGGGAGKLLHYLPNAKLVVHPRGIPHVINPEKLWTQAKQALREVAELYGEPLPVPEDRIIPAEDKMRLDLGNGIEIQVIETLGHASHHVSFYEGKSQTVFVGDTAGIHIKNLNITLPTTPPLLFLDGLIESIDKLIMLKPRRLCYTHFGSVTDAVERLEAYKNQLKLWASIVQRGLQNKEGLEKIQREIMNEDQSLKFSFNYVNENPILKRIVVHSVEGFISYFKKFKKNMV